MSNFQTRALGEYTPRKSEYGPNSDFASRIWVRITSKKFNGDFLVQRLDTADIIFTKFSWRSYQFCPEIWVKLWKNALFYNVEESS